MAEANRDHLSTAPITFRVGLHLGDLIVDGDDLYGDGVNVAARLEAEAPAGGIVGLGAVHEAVAGRLKAAFRDLGSLALKNIERPVSGVRGRMEPGGMEDVRGSARPWPSVAPPPLADVAALRFPTSPRSPCCRSRT